MGPRSSLRDRALIGALLLIIVIHTIWGHLIPSQVFRLLRRTVSQTVAIGGVRLDVPLSLVLVDVAVHTAAPDLVASSQRVTLVPRWVSWRTKTVWLNTLKFDGLTVRCRRNGEGTLELPLPPPPPVPSPAASDAPPAPSSAPAAGPSEPPWTVVTKTIQIVGGTLEFVDETIPQPFRGALTDLSLVGGPLTLPSGPSRLSLAVQGRFVGPQGPAAPVYCSGWLDLEPRNFEISCQLESLPLAAFESYSRGPLQVRVYDATLKVTAKFTAKANELEGRAQLEVGNLSQGDLSFLGVTIADIRTITGGADQSLAAEVQLSGPLDQPAAWKVQFVAGNEIVQRMLQPLFNRGIENVTIKVGQQTIQVGLTPASEEGKSSMQEASKTVEESLKILAPEPPQAPSGPVPPAPGSVSPSADAGTPQTGSQSPAPAASP